MVEYLSTFVDCRTLGSGEILLEHAVRDKFT